MKTYYGTTISPQELKVLEALEKQTGKIPKVEEVGEEIPRYKYSGWYNFGFKEENSRVIGLLLYKKGLTSLPEKFHHLKHLEVLNLAYNEFT